MDGYRWERVTGEDYDYVQIGERIDIWEIAGIDVDVARFAEFAAWVAQIAAEVGESD